MADILPPEYQALVNQGLDKQRLAQMLMQNAGRQPQGQMVGGYYIKPSTLSSVSSTLANILGMKMQQEGEQTQQEGMQKYAMADRDAAAQVLQAAQPHQVVLPGPPVEGPGPVTGTVPGDMQKAESLGLASPFPSARKLAEELAKRRMELFKVAAPTSTGQSVQEAALAGGDVAKLAPNTWTQPDVQTLPNGQQIVTATDQRGSRPVLQAPPVPANQKFGQGEIEAQMGDLRKQRPEIAKIKAQIPGLVEAQNILSSGQLNTGTASEIATKVQKLGKFLGINVPPEAANTEYFYSFVVPQVAQMVKSFGSGTGISDADRAFAEKAAASPSKDPRAAAAVINMALKGAMGQISQHDQSVERTADAARSLGLPTQVFEPLFVYSGDLSANPAYKGTLERANTPYDPTTAGPAAGQPQTQQPDGTQVQPRPRKKVQWQGLLGGAQ